MSQDQGFIYSLAVEGHSYICFHSHNSLRHSVDTVATNSGEMFGLPLLIERELGMRDRRVKIIQKQGKKTFCAKHSPPVKQMSKIK